MDTALPQKFPFILYRKLANANCTGNRVCTSCDIVVLVFSSHKLLRSIYIYKVNPLGLSTFAMRLSFARVFGKDAVSVAVVRKTVA